MTQPRSSVRGALPAPTAGTAAGQPLPPGQLVLPDPEFAPDADGTPVAWVSRAPHREVAATCDAIARSYAEHGLWPFVADTLDASGRPWTSGEFAGAQPLATAGSNELLAALWSQAVPEDEADEADALAEIAPFAAAWPGLAAAGSGRDDDAALAAVRGELTGHLGLCAVSRPALVPAAIGWQGAVNFDLEPGAIAAVLCDWEDRFGAVLVGIGFDTLTLAVQRPPRTIEHATAVAAELFAFCPDIVQQGVGSIEELAAELVDTRRWSFWWD
ncbi:MAG: DUF4253 domain-containing protein [Planctomycetes bacterium]|jgi:hypothetical protein|nr:DUF4253 domain-containing protein [Planctomycetota bacterium]